MRRVCFLSMDDMSGYVADDDLAIAPLSQLGWQVETVSWRDQHTVWDEFEAVIIRTTWDYQLAPEEFLRVLKRIEASSARLENPLSVVAWNLNKRYLREMELRGCPIVPTIWDAAYTESEFAFWKTELFTDEVIIKPEISATAGHTYRLSSFDPGLTEIFHDRRFMVQPFMPAIEAEGEYSLFYFGGEFSHAITKIPAPDDFRVQEEYGGIITAIAGDKKLLDAGQYALDSVGETLLYARVDLVRDEAGNFRLMEVELIEPALYLRMSERAPTLFAEAFHARMNEL